MRLAVLILCHLILLAYAAVPRNVKQMMDHKHDGHKCIHDKLEQTRASRGETIPMISQNLKVNKLSQKEAELKIKKRSAEGLQQNLTYPTFLPIRILVDSSSLDNDPYTCYAVGQRISALSDQVSVPYTCTDGDVLTTAKKNYLLNTLLAVSKNQLQNALSVVQLSNLNLAGISSCTSTAFPVPVAANYRNPGVTGADFVIFVTARPILGGGTLAFASTCAIEDIGRPIAGHANFNASNLVDIANDLPRQSGIAVHEISHALGFSSSRWSGGTFIKYLGTQTGGNYDYQTLSSTTVTQTLSDAGGDPFTRIITPTVVAMVRSHFNCSDLSGSDIENGGGAGTTGSHWEKRVFNNEYMTGSESNFPIFSNITLALFHDSGWYRANFSAAVPLLWGNKWGCAFVENDCGGWTSNPNLPPEGFCNKPPDPTDVHCTFDRRGYGICNIAELSTALPAQYQHYGNAYWGGQDPLADYCGYIGQRGATTFCNTGGTSSVTQVTDAISFISDYGEQFELGSRCMFSTLNKIKTPVEIESFQVLLAPVPRSARCYNQTCVSPTDLRVQINGVWYPCPTSPRDGKYLISGVFGFGGELECPPPPTLCAGTTPDYSWPKLLTISPTEGPPSTKITIEGANFDPARNYEVIMEIGCTNVTVINSTHMTAIIPPGSHFVSLADLEFFKTKKNLIIRDYRGFTDQRAQIFTIQVKLDGEYIKNLSAWMSQNPLWALLVWTVILLPLFCIAGCLYKFLRRPQKPKKGGYHADTHPDQYYDDDYAVDDYYDDYGGNGGGGGGGGGRGGRGGGGGGDGGDGGY